MLLILHEQSKAQRGRVMCSGDQGANDIDTRPADAAAQAAGLPCPFILLAQKSRGALFPTRPPQSRLAGSR